MKFWSPVLTSTILYSRGLAQSLETTEFIYEPKTKNAHAAVLHLGKEATAVAVPTYERLSANSLPILQNKPDDCFVPQLEMLLLIDISAGTWEEFVLPVTAALAVVLEDAMTVFPRSRVALSTFSDKSIPHSGRGSYGGFADEDIDTCYQMNCPFTGFNDQDGVKDIIRHLKEVKGQGGLDTEEAQLDALVRAATDPDLEWSPIEKHIERVALLFTDGVGHEATFKSGSTWISAWNEEVTCVNETTTTGGFGASDFPGYGTSSAFITLYQDKYARLQSLYARELCGSGVDEIESVELNQLWSDLGPRKFPELKEHPGDNSLGCNETEYPSYKLVTETLQREELNLVVMYMPPTESADVANHWEYIVSSPDALGGVSPAYMKLEPSLQTMYDKVFQSLTDVLTWEPCTTPAPSTSSTATSEVTSTEDPTRLPMGSGSTDATESSSGPSILPSSTESTVLPTSTTTPPTTRSTSTLKSTSIQMTMTSTATTIATTPATTLSVHNSATTAGPDCSTSTHPDCESTSAPECIPVTDPECLHNCTTTCHHECNGNCDQIVIALKDKPKRVSIVIENE